MSKVLFYFAIVLAMFVSLTQSLSVLKKTQKRSIENEQNHIAISNYIADCKDLLGESYNLEWQKKKATSLGKRLNMLMKTGISEDEYNAILAEIPTETNVFDFYELYLDKMRPVLNKLNQSLKNEYTCLNEMFLCLDYVYSNGDGFNNEIGQSFIQALKGTEQNGIDPYKCNQYDYTNIERTLLRGNYTTENDFGNNVRNSLQGVEVDDVCVPTDTMCIYKNECKNVLGSTTGDSDWAEKKAIGLAKGIYNVVSKKISRGDIIPNINTIQDKNILYGIIDEYKLKL
ncbi:hypothetical protein BB560_005475, partial [Smittium megazygosporum]